MFNRVCLKNGFERAIYWFCFRLLARSEQHFLAFGAYVVLGFLIASAEILSRPTPQLTDMIRGSLSLAYLVAVGWRAAVEIPGGRRAAWIIESV